MSRSQSLFHRRGFHERQGNRRRKKIVSGFEYRCEDRNSERSGGMRRLDINKIAVCCLLLREYIIQSYCHKLESESMVHTNGFVPLSISVLFLRGK